MNNAPKLPVATRNAISVTLLAAVLLIAAPGCKKMQVGKGPSPEETELTLHRGARALEDGRYSDAIPDLEAVLDARPEDTNSRYNLGVASQRVKSYRESVEVLTAWGDRKVEVRQLGQKIKVPVDADGDYLYALGTSYQEMRLLDEAQQCFNVAVGEFPNHLQSRYGRAMVLQQRGKLQEAQSAWTDYLQRDPHSAWADGARRHLAAVDEKLAASQP